MGNAEGWQASHYWKKALVPVTSTTYLRLHVPSREHAAQPAWLEMADRAVEGWTSL